MVFCSFIEINQIKTANINAVTKNGRILIEAGMIVMKTR